MVLRQDGWIIFLRATLTQNGYEMIPRWGQVGELKEQDVLWSEDIRNFFCIVSCHKELDTLVIDEYMTGQPTAEMMEEIGKKIVLVTNQMFDDSDFTTVGKKITKGFRKNSLFYLNCIPDCIKGRFDKLR